MHAWCTLKTASCSFSLSFRSTIFNICARSSLRCRCRPCALWRSWLIKKSTTAFALGRQLAAAGTRELSWSVARMERPRGGCVIRDRVRREVPAFRGDGSLRPPNCLSGAELLGGIRLLIPLRTSQPPADGRPARRKNLGFLGVRLWLADVAPRVSFSRARVGAALRRASRAVRALPRASRHAGAARPRARARPRRHLPRHRLSHARKE